MKGIGRGKNPKSNNIIKVEKRGREYGKLNRLQKEELVTKIIEWICEGLAKGTIKDLILKNSPVILNHNDAYDLIKHSIARLTEITKQEVGVVVNVHMEIYEKIYKYFESIDNADGQNKALKAKEKLSGMFRGTNKVVVNNRKKTVINRMIEYDMGQLNDEQKKRMQELLNKAK